MYRFDVVVLNYARLHLFFSNWHRIQGFDVNRDRLTVVSCSPSREERALVDRFERDQGIKVRYLTRPNRGIDQLARADYFAGTVGDLDENLDAEWTMHVQDHYFAPDDPSSRWGPELDGRVKGDVVPDGVVFDLPALDRLGKRERLDAIYADRNRPSLVELEGRRYIAPNGGNFTLATKHLRDPDAQAAFRQLQRTCDDRYTWAVYAEYAWGLIFFPEGRRCLDLTTGRIYDEWDKAEFYETPDDYARLIRLYSANAPMRRIYRVADAVRARLGQIAERSGLGERISMLRL